MKRWLKFRNQSRPDIGGDNRGRFSLGFLHYMVTFNLTRLSRTFIKLKPFKEFCELIVLQGKSEITQFIEKLPEAGA